MRRREFQSLTYPENQFLGNFEKSMRLSFYSILNQDFTLPEIHNKVFIITLYEIQIVVFFLCKFNKIKER